MKRGYWYVYSPNHPRAQKKGYVAEKKEGKWINRNSKKYLIA